MAARTRAASKRLGIPFRDPKVRAAFDAHPKKTRDRLIALRRLIFEVAEATEGVGPLEETLKWGQPSYLTSKTKSGSTVRIDGQGETAGGVAMYFHCQTTLIADFRREYPRELTFEGNRAIVLVPGEPLPRKALRRCVEQALTYHLRNRSW